MQGNAPTKEPLKILLVEDEEGIRHIMQSWLARNGAAVTVAADADEAMRRWEECGGRFDLLVTDVVMPGSMDGITLAEQLRQRSEHLRVLVMSAYLGGRTDLDFQRRPGWRFQPKPFSLPKIDEVIENLMQSAEVPVENSVALAAGEQK